MANTIATIEINKLTPHPSNPNRMSGANFSRLVRNIERTGRYEPIIVRPHPTEKDRFQIINGHHRCKAISQLSHKTADCVVWDIDDVQADILLATLNRLCGRDEIDAKLALLSRLNEKLTASELSKLLPQTAKQIEQLVNMKLPDMPANPIRTIANPMVFFVDARQQRVIEQAISLAEQNGKTRAHRRSAALAAIAEHFISKKKAEGGS